MPSHPISSIRALRGEQGFTLPELLTVIVIVGVLAAIALPTFLRETDKASDADAKSNASFLVGHVEACAVEPEEFTDCDSPAELSLEGLPWGTGPGQVSVTGATENTFTVVAVSNVTTGGTNHMYTVARDLTGEPSTVRTCGAEGKGGCPTGGNW